MIKSKNIEMDEENVEKPDKILTVKEEKNTL